MATGTNGIATQLNANALYTDTTGNLLGPYQDHAERNRCITYASAISAGFTVANAIRYTSNTKRLVRYSDLYAPISYLTFKLTINISEEPELYNKGPITLVRAGGDLIPLAYARDVEAVEVEHDASGIPLDYPVTHNDDSAETNMTLSTIDEVLQVAQDFEEQDQILGAPIRFLGLSLTKDDASTTNLLDASTYGPANVYTKSVTYTLLSTTYSSSSNGSYKLNYAAAANCLKNKDGLYPSGALTASKTSTAKYETITVNSAGTYTFNAYWNKNTIDPSIPSTTTTWKLYFRVRVSTSLRWYQVRLALTNWKLLDYDGTTCLSGNLPYTYYTSAQMEMDLMHANSTIDDGYAVYVIPLGSYTEGGTKGEPAYIGYDTLSVAYTDRNNASLMMTDWGIDNTITNGALNAGADRAIIFSDLNNTYRVYISVYINTMPGSDFEDPFDPIRPIV